MTEISQNRPFHLNNIVPFVKFNNSLRLPKGVLLTPDSRFQGKGDFQNVRLTENQIIVNAGLSKSFLNDQLNLSLKGYDLFYGQKEANMIKFSQSELYQQNCYDSRQLETTVRYRFNAAKSKYKGTRAGKRGINRL